MTNPYYNPSGTPATGSTGASSPIRTEYQAIAAGFALLPVPSIGTAGQVVTINPGGTALTANSALVFDVSGNAAFTANASLGTAGSALSFTSTAQRILGDFSNATVSSRTLFQDKGANNSSSVGVIPNGTGATATFAAINSSSPNNAAYLALTSGTTVSSINSGVIGTGTQLPLVFQINGTEYLRIATGGNVSISAPSSGTALSATGVSGGSSAQFTDGVNSTLIISHAATARAVINSLGSGVLAFQTNSTDRVVIANAGNVTINAPSSGTALSATGVSGGTVFSATTVGSLGVGFNVSGPAATGLNVLTWQQSGQSAWALYQSASDGTARFASSGSDRLLIAAAGNVTINAPTSGVGLTVNGTGNDNTAVFNQSGIGLGATSGVMVANAHYTGTWQYLGAGAAWGIGNNFGGPTNGLTFAMAAVGAGGGAITWTTPITIANAGNVTINAPSSGTTLTINSLVGSNGWLTTDGTCQSFLYSNGASGSSIGTVTNHSFGLATNNTTRVTIGNAGNITIAAPANSVPTLVVKTPTGTTAAVTIWGTGGSDTSQIIFLTTAGATTVGALYADSTVGISLSANAGGGITITPTGAVTVGAPTSASYTLTVTGTSTDSQAALQVVKGSATNTTSQILVRFSIFNGLTGSGNITSNGANAAAFGSTSDVRLKKNIVSLDSQLAKLQALRPVEFDYIDGSGHQVGFVAQELAQVYEDCVGDGHDGYLQVIGWSKTDARLVKAIQELAAKVAALEARGL